MRTCKSLSHFFVGMLLFTGIVCSSHFSAASFLAQSNDENVIRTLVESLLELYQHKDLNKLISLWSDKSPFLGLNKRTLQNEFTANDKIALKKIEIRKIGIEGDQAILRVTADLVLSKTKAVGAVEKVERKNRTLHLVNENGTWKVWKFVSSEEELAKAIIAAKTDEERNSLIEKEPDLVESDLADALIRQNTPLSTDQGGYQRALAINKLAHKLGEKTGD
jgi:hypothetical protein